MVSRKTASLTAVSCLFYNDELLPAATACVSANDRGFLIGDGLFETLFVQQGEPHLFAQHYARLQQSAKTMRIPFSTSAAQLREQIATLCQTNLTAVTDSAVCRITLTRGVSATRGLALPDADCTPTTLVTLAPYERVTQATFALALSPVAQPPCPLLSGVKTLNYSRAVLLRAWANEQGANDVLCRYDERHVVGTSAANVFCLHAGKKSIRLTTPSLDSGCLPGVVRAVLLQHPKNNALERPMTVSSLFEADTVFITNSLIGLQPVTRLDGKALKQAPEHLETLRLQLALAVEPPTNQRRQS